LPEELLRRNEIPPIHSPFHGKKLAASSVARFFWYMIPKLENMYQMITKCTK
jgi:hypothetical protein